MTPTVVPRFTPPVGAATFAPTFDEADLPQLAWTKLSGPPMTAGNYSTPYIVDIETGDIYSIVGPDWDGVDDATQIVRTVSIDGWSETRGLVVTLTMSYAGTDKGAVTRSYAAQVGRPFQALPKLSTNGWIGTLRVEAGGLASVEFDTTGPQWKAPSMRTVILDPLTFARGQVLDRTLSSFSPDGRFLAAANEEDQTVDVFEKTAAGYRAIPGMTGISGDLAGWSHGTLVAINQRSAGIGRTRLMLFDATTGDGRELGDAGSAMWSRDDRNLAATLVPINPEDSPGFVIYDVATGTPRLRVTGSWPLGWTADGSFAFTGNVCDTFDVFTVAPDGSNLRRLVTGGAEHPWGHYLSPDGRTLLYADYYGPSTSMKVMDLASGTTQSFEIGTLSILIGVQWLDDGRYVKLNGPVGKDGPCYGIGGGPHAVEVTPLP